MQHSYFILSTLKRFLLLSCLGALCTGCVVVPYVVPPLRVQGQGGLAVGNVYESAEANEMQYSATTPISTLRVGAFPLGFIDELIDREFDIGVGFIHERLYLKTHSGQEDRAFNGAFLEGHYWFYTHVDEMTAIRAGLIVDVDYLQGVGGQYGAGEGFGVFTGLGVEWVTNSEGFFMSGSGGGSAGKDYITGGFLSGEAGIGLVIGSSYRQIGNEPYWTFTAGLSLRLPAAAGVIVIFDD